MTARIDRLTRNAVVAIACMTGVAVAYAQSGFKSASFDPPGLYHDQKAEDLFTQARIGISGGPGGIARLQGLRFKGHSKVPGSDGQIFDGAVEVRIQLPDKYLRIDSGAFGRRLSGYSGVTSLALIEDSTGKVTSAPTDATTVELARRELARFMLGAATWVSREVKVQLFTRETPADMPGPSDPLGVDAVGTDDRGFSARVIMDPKTRMPVRVVHRSGTDIVTMAIVERKASGGYKLPSHIVTTAGARVVDDMTFDEIVVNPKFAQTDFTK